MTERPHERTHERPHELDECMDRLERALQVSPRDNAHRKLVHVHIPKTAGMAFSNVLKSRIGSNKHLRWDEGAAHWKELTAERRVPRFTTGHIRMHEVFYSRDLTLMPINLVTIVRKPIDRVVSNYNYGRSERHPNSDAFSERFGSLTDYVEKMTENGNFQSRWVSLNYRHPSIFFDILGRFHMGIAPLERIEDYAAALQRVMAPGRPHPMDRINELGTMAEGRRKATLDEVPSELLARFEEANALDTRLYEAAGEAWERRAGNLVA